MFLTKINRSFFTIVRQGTVGVRELLGTNRELLKPGVHLNLPFLHLFRHIELREDMITINEINAYTHDNVPVKISGSLFFRIDDPLKSVYSVTYLRHSLGSLGQSAARSIVGMYEYDSIIKDRHEFNNNLSKNIHATCTHWGVVCEKFEIQEFGPQNNQVAAQLERQLIAERERRENEYNTLAKVRTAEGMKQATILKSEGDLQAKKNEADAEAYVIETKTKALANQIKNISEILNDPQLSASFLLEKERLVHLSSIASGTNNNTYFLNSSSDKLVVGAKLLGDQLKH